MQDATRTRLLMMAEADSGEDGDVKYGMQTLAMAQMERDMRDENREDRKKKKDRSFWYYKFPGMVAAILGALGYGGYEMASAPTERLEAVEIQVEGVETQVEENAKSIDALADHAASSEILDAERQKHLERKIDAIAPGAADSVEKSELLKAADERADELIRQRRADEIIRATGPH